MGRRSEKVRSALAMARARLIPDAMAVGHCIIDTSGEKRLVQGKFRTRVLFGEAVSHQQVLNLMKRDTTFKKTHDGIVKSLTSDAQQFKVERIDKKVSHYKARKNVQPRPSRGNLTRRYDLTPLMSNKIQYAKMLKDHNIDQVRK